MTALKMAEPNACMRRIVAAPTAGSCGVIPAVLVPYYNRAMAGIESKIPVDEVCYPQLVGTIQLSGGRRHVKKYIWSF